MVLGRVYGLIYGCSKVAIYFTMNFYAGCSTVIWRLLLILIAKLGVALKNLGNLLHYRHKDFENQLKNSWDTWGQSLHLQHRNYFSAFVPLTGANFDLKYLSYFWIDFQNSCAYIVDNFLTFSTTFAIRMSRSHQIKKTNCGTTNIKDMW